MSSEEGKREFAAALAKAGHVANMTPEFFAEVCGLAVALYLRVHSQFNGTKDPDITKLFPLVAQGISQFQNMEVRVIHVQEGAEDARH